MSTTGSVEYLVCSQQLLCYVYGSAGICILYALVLPVGIYYTHKFYQYRQHPALQVRYPEICIFSATICVIHAFVAEQYFYLQRMFMTEQTIIILWISKLILPPLFLMMAVSIVFRFWIIHFNIRYAISQEKNDWQTLLAGGTSLKRDWYDRHIRDYGNWKFVKKYFIGYFIVGALLEVTAVALQHPSLLNLNAVFASLTNTVCGVPPTVFGACLVCKTPAFEDSFFVRKEMKYLSSIAVIGILMYLPTSVLYFAGEIFYWLTVSTLTFITFGFVIVMTAMVLREVGHIDPHMDRYKNIRMYQFSKAKQHLSVDPNDILELMRNISKFGDRVTQDDDDIHISYKQLFHILISDDIGINMLFTHLRTEFAIENLMGFIELIQFIRNVTDSRLDGVGVGNGNAQYDPSLLKDLRYDFASSVPITACNAVYDATQDNWWAPMQLIYKKHISTAAQYQLNLPFDLQQRFARLMQLLDIQLQLRSGTYVFKNKPNTDRSSAGKETFSFWRRFTKTESTVHCAPVTPQTPSRRFTLNPDATEGQSLTAAPKNTILEEVEHSPAMGAVHHETHAKSLQHLNISALPQLDDGSMDTPSTSTPRIVIHHQSQFSTPIPGGTNEAHSPYELVPIVSTQLADRNRSKSAPNDVQAHRNETIYQKNSSIFESFVSMLRRGSSMKPNTQATPQTPHTENDERKSEAAPPNTAYLEELEEIQKAKQINKFNFIAASACVIACILQLNYQSVSRFKKTVQFQRFKESVNLKHLLQVLEEQNTADIKTENR